MPRRIRSRLAMLAVPAACASRSAQATPVAITLGQFTGAETVVGFNAIANERPIATSA